MVQLLFPDNSYYIDVLTHVKTLCDLHSINPITETEEFIGGKCTETNKQISLATLSTDEGSPLPGAEANQQTQISLTMTIDTDEGTFFSLLVQLLFPDNSYYIDVLTDVKTLCKLHSINPITATEEFIGGKWYYSISCRCFFIHTAVALPHPRLTVGEEALGYASDVERDRARKDAVELAHESVDSLLRLA